MWTTTKEFQALPKDVQDKIRELEKNAGAYKTLNGLCPIGATRPLACMFCSYGHMTECHHPLMCDEAECSHYKIAMSEDVLEG